MKLTQKEREDILSKSFFHQNVKEDQFHPLILSEYISDPQDRIKTILTDLGNFPSGSILIEVPLDHYYETVNTLEVLGKEKHSKCICRSPFTFDQSVALSNLELVDGEDFVFKVDEEKRIVFRCNMPVSDVINFSLIEWGNGDNSKYMEELVSGEKDVKKNAKIFPKREKIVDYKLKRYSLFTFFIRKNTFVDLSFISLTRIYAFFRYKQSKKQFAKDITADLSGFAGGMGGSVLGAQYGASAGSAFLPVFGTTIGAFAGGAAGGFVGKYVVSGLTKFTLELLIRDDHERMAITLSKGIQKLSIKYLMSKKESKEFCKYFIKELMNNNGKGKSKNYLFSLYTNELHRIKKSERLDYAIKRVEPFIIKYLKKNRKRVNLPKEYSKFECVPRKIISRKLTKEEEKKKILFLKYKNAPKKFLCGIGGMVMMNPYTASNGKNYEKEQIEWWIKYSKSNNDGIVKDPEDSNKILKDIIVPNEKLKKEISEYLEHKIYDDEDHDVCIL